MMKRALMVSGVVAVWAMGGVAGAQVVGPGGGGAEVGGAGMSIAPPTVDAGTGTGRAETAGRSYLVAAYLGTVNNEPVNVTDILRPADEGLRKLAAQSRNQTEFERGARALISDALQTRKQEILLVSAAERAMTEEDKQRLDLIALTDRKNLLSKYGGVETEAEKKLAATGSSMAKEMEYLRRKHVVDFYIYKRIGTKIEVTYPMVRAAYEKDPKKWQQEATIELFTITLPVARWLREPTADGTLGPVKSNATPAEIQAAEGQAMATAREIVAKLKNKEDFATLVEQYNSKDDQAIRGGRAAAATKGTLNAKLADFVFGLPANSVGEPLMVRENDYKETFVVVAKVGEKKEARTVTFEEAQDQIVQTLRTQQFEELRTAEMAMLARGASVEAIDRPYTVDVAVDAAVARYWAR